MIASIRKKARIGASFLVILPSIVALPGIMSAVNAEPLRKNDQGPEVINGAVQRIQDSTRSIARNTEPTLLQATDTDEYVNLSLSLIAAFGTLLTAVAVQLEFRQRAISSEIQRRVLSDLVRHLYRNKVCVCATSWKLEEKGYARNYPSEEHLLKLKVLPEDLRFDRFNNTPQYYDILHSLELKFRNYNTEIDVALAHLKDPLLTENIKRRDLQVLSKKSDYLTTEILQLRVISEGRFRSSPEMSLLISSMIAKRINTEMIKPGRPGNSLALSENKKILRKASSIIDRLLEQTDVIILQTSAQYSKASRSSSLPSTLPVRPASDFDFFAKRDKVRVVLDEDIKRELDVISLLPFPGRRYEGRKGRVIRR
jgi:hypothetical protein